VAVLDFGRELEYGLIGSFLGLGLRGCSRVFTRGFLWVLGYFLWVFVYVYFCVLRGVLHFLICIQHYLSKKNTKRTGLH
jgi:hypothetical protein